MIALAGILRRSWVADKDRRDRFRKSGLNGVPAYLPNAFELLGLPCVRFGTELNAELAKGSGYATAAILAALSTAVGPAPSESL